MKCSATHFYFLACYALYILAHFSLSQWKYVQMFMLKLDDRVQCRQKEPHNFKWLADF
jgi:hypothetical protein